jgi:hypothetical protein
MSSHAINNKRKAPEPEQPQQQRTIPIRCDGFTLAPGCDAPDEELLCPIYQGVLLEPLQHKACGMCVCKACLMAAGFKCPHCNSDDAKSFGDYIQPTKILTTLCDRVKVECPGCKHAVERGRLAAHIHGECTEKASFVGLACSVCREYTSAPGQEGKCSQCFVAAHGHDAAFRDHPLLNKKARIEAERDWKMEELDSIFTAHRPDHIILTEAQATVFIRAYKGASPDDMLAAYLGRREFPKFVLRAADVDRLVAAIGVERIDRIYRLAHVIGPRVLDRWNVRVGGSVMSCYWLGFGGLRAPKFKAELHDNIWRYVGTAYMMQ